MTLPGSIDRAQSFRYMGLHGDAPAQLHALADTCEKRLLSAVSPRFTYKVFPLRFCEEGVLCEGSRLLLTGEDIRAHLDGCSHAVLLCVTLSGGADAAIRRAMAEEITAGTLTDAMASALTEQVCDLAEEEILAGMPESYAAWRFSPGYGDLPLSVQEEFLRVLDAQKRVGVCVSECGLLLPRKSVTAIIGLSDKPMERRRKGCAACNLSKTCPYRAKGDHCK